MQTNVTNIMPIMGTFMFFMVYCGMCGRCIVGFVRLFFRQWVAIAGTTIHVPCHVGKSLQLFEARALVDFIYGFPIVKLIELDLKISPQVSSHTNGCQRDLPYWYVTRNPYHRYLELLTGDEQRERPSGVSKWSLCLRVESV